MNQGPGIPGQRLIALFLLGCLLFNYPLLYLFNVDHRLFGIPLLYVYVFAAWALLITLTALVLERASGLTVQTHRTRGTRLPQSLPC